MRGASGNHRAAGVDDLQRLGMVSALEIERLVIGAVDIDHLASVQIDPNTSRRVTTLVGEVPHHNVETAMAAVWLIEGDDALAPDRRENRVVRPDWS